MGKKKKNSQAHAVAYATNATARVPEFSLLLVQIEKWMDKRSQ